MTIDEEFVEMMYYSVWGQTLHLAVFVQDARSDPTTAIVDKDSGRARRR